MSWSSAVATHFNCNEMIPNSNLGLRFYKNSLFLSFSIFRDPVLILVAMYLSLNINILKFQWSFPIWMYTPNVIFIKKTSFLQTYSIKRFDSHYIIKL